jgi:hypothetical protein
MVPDDTPRISAASATFTYSLSLGTLHPPPHRLELRRGAQVYQTLQRIDSIDGAVDPSALDIDGTFETRKWERLPGAI